MKISIVHSFYASDQPSGENTVVLQQVQKLSDAGHDVLLVARYTDDLQRESLYKLRSALRVATGLGTSPAKEILEFDPDVIHVHNLFPNFGTSWAGHLSKKYPIVSTLHNFRIACASATLFRDGKPCDLCVTSPASGMRHACYRDNRLNTLPLTLAQYRGYPSSSGQTVVGNSARVIALSPRAAQKINDSGVAQDKIRVIPNPAPDPRPNSSPTPAQGWCYAGRLTPEKGIEQLVRVWPQSEALTIYGDGPLRSRLGELTSGMERVTMRGSLPRSELLEALSRFEGLLFPSLYPESAPMVYAEALSLGLPTIALQGNSVADHVRKHGTGVAIESLSTASVLAAMNQIRLAKADYRSTCLGTAGHELSSATWVERLTEIYYEALSER